MQAGRTAAYDLSLFEPKENKQPEQKHAKLRIVKKQGAARVSTKAIVKAAVLGTVILAMLVCMMLNNVKLVNLSGDMTKLTTSLTNEKSEYVTLNMQLESRMSLKNVETNALTKLGMQKVQSYQIEYINMSNGDKVVVSPDSGNIFNKAASLFSRLMAYFK